MRGFFSQQENRPMTKYDLILIVTYFDRCYFVTENDLIVDNLDFELNSAAIPFTFLTI